MNIIQKLNFLVISLLCFGSCQSENSEPKVFPKQPIKQNNNTLSKDEISIGWELLFDGKTLNQWRGYNKSEFPSSGWEIDQEGNLICGQERSDIISKEKYDNFELKLEYQLSEGSKSGVFYRVLEVEAIPIWFNAPKYTLNDFLKIEQNQIPKISKQPFRKHMSGSLFDIEIFNSDLPIPIRVGEWNQVRLVVHSGFVEHWLNGERVVEYQIESEKWKTMVAQSRFKSYLNYGKSKLGYIGLEGSKSLVKFRNIKIRVL